MNEYQPGNRSRGSLTRGGRGNGPRFSSANHNNPSAFWQQTPRHHSFTPSSFQPETRVPSSQRLHPKFHSASVAHQYLQVPDPHCNPPSGQTRPYYPPRRIRVPLAASTITNHGQPPSIDATTNHILCQSSTYDSAVVSPVQSTAHRQLAPLPPCKQARFPIVYASNVNLATHPNLIDANGQPSPQATSSQNRPPSLDPCRRPHFCYRDNPAVKCFYFDNWTLSPEFKNLHHLLKERSDGILYYTCKAGISSGKLHGHRVALLQRTICKKHSRPAHLVNDIYQGIRNGTFSPLHMKAMLMACKLGGLMGVNYEVCMRCQGIFSMLSSHFATCTEDRLACNWMINHTPGLPVDNLDRHSCR